MDITIRPARPDDAPWIKALAPRLHEFGPPPWHDVDVMNESVAAGLERDLLDRSRGLEFFAAVDPAGVPLGFISLRADPDYFTAELCGHVVDIVVTHAGEGSGVGRALLGAAEQWAKDRGFPWLTLHVFDGNDRARRLYEKVGYKVEWTRMLKTLGNRESGIGNR